MKDLPDDRLLQALNDPADTTRAAAAAELARRGHPQALAACLATLDDGAEPTHAESTPAGWGLVSIGRPAIEPLLDRMADAPAATRQRAAHAFMQISKRHFGYDGTRWPDGVYPTWARWWTNMGYDDTSDADSRAGALARLRADVAHWPRL